MEDTIKKKSQRNERLLIFGRWTSKIGDIIFDYVNNITLVNTYGKSAWILALYQSVDKLVGVLFNLIGGVISDSSNKKRLIVIADLISSVICLVTSFFVDTSLVATALILANILLALVFSLSSPAFKAIVREFIAKDRIHVYNSISNAGAELIFMIAPVIGMLLLKFFNAREALLINAATFFISAIVEAFMISLDTSEKVAKKKQSILKGIAAGFTYLKNEKTVFLLVILSAFVNFFLAGYNLMLPYTDIIYRDVYKDFYSKVMVMEALGGLLGSVINTRLSSEKTKRFNTLLMFIGLMGVSLVLVPVAALSENFIVSLIPFTTAGMTLTMFNINLMSFVQIRVDENYLGRVFSIIFTVAVLFMPLGSFFFSFLFDTEKIREFGALGIGILVLVLITWLIHKTFMKEDKSENMKSE